MGATVNLLQRQAGVDPEVAELVAAYIRLNGGDENSPPPYTGEAIHGGTRDFLCGWIARKNPNLDPRILEFLVRYSRRMAARRQPIILSVKHLAKKLRMSEPRLRWMARNARSHCTEFRIPKKDGGERILLAPHGKLMTVQRWILRHILDRAKPHACATGFVEGRSIVDNAQPHAGRAVVVRLDLKDFFPSIRFEQVRRVFQSLGYPYRVASVLAGLCTADGRLPQGAPTSPALSNLVCRNLDRRLAGLAGHHKFIYTRYADDLVFSSNNEKLPKLIPFFKQLIREEGFEVNERKISVMRRGQRQVVTGLVVNEEPNLPRRQRRLLRAALHRARTAGLHAVEWPAALSADPVNALHGHLAFFRMVRPEEGTACHEQFLAVCSRDASVIERLA